MTTQKLPEWASIYIEPGKTVKSKSGKFYLYEQKCHYDKTKKHRNSVANKYLGRITKEDGFIPSKTRKAALAPESVISKHYGAYAVIAKYCGDVLERLGAGFGVEYANLIFTIASLRVMEKTPYSDLGDAYTESFFSAFDKTLPMSKSSLSSFLHELARYKGQFKAYMRKDIEDDDTLIFDGTNLLCGSQNISYSAAGYKHGHNYNSQVCPLYAYSATKRKLVYYKLFEGSVSDAKSLTDILIEAGISNGIGVLDNGFDSADNIEGLLRSKTKFIIALRRDSAHVTKDILYDSTRGNAVEKFVNNHESVFAYELKDSDNNRICIYFNQTIVGVETSEYLDKMQKGWKGFTEAGFAQAKKRFGIFVIKTNHMDLTLQDVYRYYKSRFEIEYSFDTLKNTLEFDKVYMHSDKSLESWMFINHISITITQKIYDLLKDNEINLSLRSFFKKLRQVVKQRDIFDKEEKYVLQVVPAKTRKICEKLGLI
jgi:hypothetical protein